MAGTLLIALAAALAAVPGPAQAPLAPAPAAGPATTARCAQTDRRDATLCEINAMRRAHGAPPVARDPLLEAAARAHAHDMVSRRYFGHVSPNGATLRVRVARTGWMSGRLAWSIGEDLAWGTGAAGSPARIVQAWMHSPPHRRILLASRYRVVGLGIADGTPVGRADGATYDADFGS
jgi:uncharacterized protein YkwD